MCDFQGEPKLSELLGDPILHLMLDCDRISLEDLRRLIEQTRRRREGAAAERPALH